MQNLPNIDFRKPNTNPTIESEVSMYHVPFYKDVEYFSSIDNFVGFVKSVEKMVRTSKYYSRYISYIKEDLGLTFCQVLSNIDEDLTDADDYSKADSLIEMHHGPILTLFDYTAIITDYLLANQKKINSFIVADILLQEHFNNKIQVVMLSKTVHELVHENDIFINLNQAFGDLNGFLQKYRKGLHAEQIQKINKYIKTSQKHDSFDNNTLELSGIVKKWNIENE